MRIEELFGRDKEDNKRTVTIIGQLEGLARQLREMGGVCWFLILACLGTEYHGIKVVL